MGDNTKISWTDATVNVNVGCSRVSAGCQHCYAEQVVAGLARKMAAVNPETAAFYADLTQPSSSGPRWTGVVKLHEEHLQLPIQWRRGRRIFLNSLSDTFHESLTDDSIARVFAMMAAAPQHTFQVLTKRPARMEAFFRKVSLGDVVDVARTFVAKRKFQSKDLIYDHLLTIKNNVWPLPNVWLGVSVEDQKTADERIPLLLQTPAEIRFLSCEPLLAPVAVSQRLGRFIYWPYFIGPCKHGRHPWTRCEDGCDYTSGIDWVICGSESGMGHRPMDLDWARSLRDQCVASKVAFFYKQGPGNKAGMNPTLDGVTWHEFPNTKLVRP
jgi:protein gp37